MKERFFSSLKPTQSSDIEPHLRLMNAGQLYATNQRNKINPDPWLMRPHAVPDDQLWCMPEVFFFQLNRKITGEVARIPKDAVGSFAVHSTGVAVFFPSITPANAEIVSVHGVPLGDHQAQDQYRDTPDLRPHIARAVFEVGIGFLSEVSVTDMIATTLDRNTR